MKTLNLVSWNVNGLRAVAKKGFLDWFRSEDADIVCLQETKAAPEQLPEELIAIPGYQAFFSASKVKKGYSGVVTYTKVAPRSVGFGMGEPRFDDEGRIVVAEYEDFLLYNVYFPNGKASKERLAYKLEFYEAFQTHVKRVAKRGKQVVVCGDVNTAHQEIDLARPRENQKISGFLPEERAWLDRFVGDGFVDTFRIFNQDPGHYTWWDMMSRARERNVGWRIDYFFVHERMRERVRGASIKPDVPGSDHCPVGIELLSAL